MKNKKRTNKALMSFGILGVFALLGMSMVFAYQGDPNVQGPNFSEERHEAMQEAFDSLDYQDWYNLMTENDRHQRIVDVITAENFGEFVEARNDGTLKEFRESLGLGLGQMKHGNGEALGKGYGGGQGKGLGKSQGSRYFTNSE